MKKWTRPTIAAVAWSALAVGLASAQTSQSPAPSPANDARQQAIQRFMFTIRAQLKHPLRDAADVTRQTIEVGKRVDGSPIEVDLTLPKNPAGKSLPVAVLVHGGLPDEAKPLPKAWQVYKDWGTALAASGVAAVMYDHTLGVPRRRLDQALAETDAVLSWIAKEGAGRNLDLQRVTALSFSAGGLFIPELLSDRRPLRIGRAALFYPSVGVIPNSPTAAVTDAALAERMNLASAAAQIAKTGTPLLIIRAGGDELPGLLALLDETTKSLAAADVKFELLNVPGAPHSFDFLTDSADARAAIERALQFAARP